MITAALIATAFTIAGAVYSIATSTASLVGNVYYGNAIYTFISSAPSYIGNFITVIGEFLPPYVVAPILAMLGILVSYLICHLFMNVMNTIS